MNFIENAIQLSEAQNRNLKQNINRLGLYIEGYDQLGKSVQMIVPIIQQSFIRTGNLERFAVLIRIYSLMIQDLLKGLVSFLNGYVTDASFHLRRMIESAAIAIEIIKNPEKVEIYTSFESEEQLKQYVKNFSAFGLVKRNLSTKLFSDYENLCLSVHPSSLAIGDRVFMSHEVNLSIELFECVDDQSTSSYQMHFLVMLETAHTVFSELIDGLKDEPNFDFLKAREIMEECKQLIMKNGRSFVFDNQP